MTGSILVTGAGGCIGAWVLRQLVEDNKPVVAFDLNRNTRRASLLMTEEQMQAVAWEYGDIADVDTLRQVMERHKVEAIIHLAALQVPFCKADPMNGARVNVFRDQGMTSLPTLAILAGVLGKPFEVPFTGTVGFIYAQEAAMAFIAAVSNSQQEARVYDLNGTPATVQQVLDITSRECPGVELTCAGDPLPFPGELSDEPLRSAVAEYPSWTIERGVVETIERFKLLVASGQLGESEVRSLTLSTPHKGRNVIRDWSADDWLITIVGLGD